jgi:FIMAH domain
MTGLLVAVFTAVLAGLVGRAQAAPAASFTDGSGPLLNGDFETGDLSNWTTFTTTNGLMSAGVVPFDTDNDGTATYAAQFVVGQATFEGFDVQRGGGIYQGIDLVDGDLSISADIASEFAFPFCNLDGATIQLLVDGLVADTHNFGEICGPVTEYASLNASLSIGSVGTHEIRFLITRGFRLSGVTNYLDDIVLSGSATKGALELVADLITLVESYQLDGPGTSLKYQLVTVQRMLVNDMPQQACKILDSFLNQVEAQTGNGLTIEQAMELTTDAQRIMTVLGC